jgi:MFS family permease
MDPKMTSSFKHNHLRELPWLPAALLIAFQTAGGLRDMPLGSFFPIFLQEKLGLAPVTITSVVAGAQVAGMLAALLGGALTARLGSKRVILTSLGLSVLGCLAFQARALWLVALLWFFNGAGVALAYVGGSTYLTRVSARGALGILSAFFALSMTFGGALGNPLAGVLIEQSGFGAYAWLGVGVSAAVLLLLSLLMQDLRDQPGAPVTVQAKSNASVRGMLAIARQDNVRRVIVLRCLPTFFYGMLVVLIPLLLNQLSGSKVLVAAYGTTNLVVASLAQLAAGRAADRWGARGPSLAAYCVLIAAGLGLALSAGTVWGLYAFGVLGIAAAWSLSTMMFLWVNDGVARGDHPPTFGLLHAVWSLSMIAGSLFGGWFVARLPGLPFLIGGLANLASLFLVFGYYRRESVRQIIASRI